MQPKRTDIAVSQMDSMLGASASSPQIPTRIEDRRHRIQIGHSPELRAFVTDKVTNLPGIASPGGPTLARHKEHTIVLSQSSKLLLNIRTAPTALPGRRPAQLPPLGGATGAPLLPLRGPMGSVQPPLNRMPGRHRFFVSDCQHKLI